MPDASLDIKILYGLTRTENTLGGWRSLGVAERLEHVKEAETYSITLAEVASRSQKIGDPIQVRLEQNIIRGNRALLESRSGADREDTRRSASEAVEGIDTALWELNRIDPTRHEKILDYASKWRKRITKIRYGNSMRSASKFHLLFCPFTMSSRQ